jgi:large subunit ribosomal protein L4e
MKLAILDSKNKEIKKRELPKQFSEPLRTDLIKKAVLAIESNSRQPYGSDPRAGMKVSAKLSRRRKRYRGGYGTGISRVPRKILSRRGTRMNWMSAQAPGTFKGRRAHPPKVEKDWTKSINTKERRKAIRSALSATVVRELVEGRGHLLPKNYPFIIDSSAESVAKTKDAMALFEALGLGDELARVSERTIRAGRATMRGRKYKQSKGPLVAVSKACPLMDAAKNIPGIEVVSVDRLNAILLAPGIKAGRLTIFTEGAIDRLEKEQLFRNERKVSHGSA